MIELDRVTKLFGSRVAVDGLSLSVPRGEVFGLLGHNGAGKSTAIGMMLGQVWPTAGTVRVCGHDVHRDRRRALTAVGAIFEAPAFYDELSGWRNLEILATYTGPVARSRMLEVVEWVGLSGRERSRVRTYSHGMRARLAIAQALLPGPELLILDEPGDGLDPEGIHEMRQTIRRLRQELGLTILLSSHQLGEVEQLCGRICVMREGRRLFEGTLEEVRGRGRRVRLETDDFERVAAGLKADALILSSEEGGWATPSEGVEVDELVRWMVGRGVPVHGAVREERTLEGFYLELMRQGGEGRRA